MKLKDLNEFHDETGKFDCGSRPPPLVPKDGERGDEGDRQHNNWYEHIADVLSSEFGYDTSFKIHGYGGTIRISNFRVTWTIDITPERGHIAVSFKPGISTQVSKMEDVLPLIRKEIFNV